MQLFDYNFDVLNRIFIEIPSLHFRFKMETVDDVLDGLESGVQHALQAGIDRVNQHAKTLSHEIKDWRIMPHPFTYAVSEICKSPFQLDIQI